MGFRNSFMKNRKEESLQIAVARYLRLQYPNIIFRSDTAAGIKLTMGQAVKNRAMQSGRGFPDMFIAYPNNGYHGLFLELKKDRKEVYLQDGSISRNKHIQEQLSILNKLREVGYMAEFACGFDEAKSIIDNYTDAKFQ